VKFGSNSAIGNFAPGDVMRCDAGMARHLVDEAGVAVYTEPAAPAPAAQLVPQQQADAPAKATRTRKTRGA
jgi:hypothetical protein